MFLMSTSPGARGGKTVLDTAKTYFPYLGGNIVSDFSLPSFYDNFKDGKIINELLAWGRPPDFIYLKSNASIVFE